MITLNIQENTVSWILFFFFYLPLSSIAGELPNPADLKITHDPKPSIAPYDYKAALEKNFTTNDIGKTTHLHRQKDEVAKNFYAQVNSLWASILGQEYSPMRLALLNEGYDYHVFIFQTSSEADKFEPLWGDKASPYHNNYLTFQEPKDDQPKKFSAITARAYFYSRALSKILDNRMNNYLQVFQKLMKTELSNTKKYSLDFRKQMLEWNQIDFYYCLIMLKQQSNFLSSIKEFSVHVKLTGMVAFAQFLTTLTPEKINPSASEKDSPFSKYMTWDYKRLPIENWTESSKK